MRRLSSWEVRQSFLDFFAKRGHTIVQSSSLVPKADPTLLFTNAGMAQFKDVFLGVERRPYTRATSCQKCVRAGGKHNDLENVGRTARHHTFFEMLGNFSFGDYFKREAIEYAWELLTVNFGLPPEKLWATIFQEDDETFLLWQKIAGMPAERIVRLGEKDNFWAMGETGPSGPCSELVIDQGPGVGCGRPECDLACGCDRYLELWNLVFMQYDRGPDGNLTPLPNPSIDTGAGLERLAAVLQGVPSNFETDLLRPLIARLEEPMEKRYGEDPKADVSMRVIADHVRAVTFLVSDGVLPSNEGRGYVLRRILRRALRHGRLLGIEGPFLAGVSETAVKVMGEAYPELEATQAQVARVLLLEEERFAQTLTFGLERVEALFQMLQANGATVVPGEAIFKLYDTYGFPLDLLRELAEEQEFAVDEAGFDREMALQRKRAKAQLLLQVGDVAAPEVYRDLSSRCSVQFTGYDRLEDEALVVALLKEGWPMEVASPGEEMEVILDETPFYAEAGGQLGDVGVLIGEGVFYEVFDTKAPVPGLYVHRGRVRYGTLRVGSRVKARVEGERRGTTMKHHTATHLVHAALRAILGDHVKQAGSLVAPDRLRFDFTHFGPLKPREIERIEDLVNEKLWKNLPVFEKVMALEEALKMGAMAMFWEKYPEQVRVIDIPDFSLELCGGTHVKATGEIGLLKIVSEGGVAAGVRRIEALSGPWAFQHLKREEEVLRELAERLKARPLELPSRVDRLSSSTKELERELERLRARLTSRMAEELLKGATQVGGTQVIAGKVELLDQRGLRGLADQIRARVKTGVVVLGTLSPSEADLPWKGLKRVQWLAAVTPDLSPTLHAGKLVQEVAKITGGSGGGKADLAEAGGKDPDKLDQAIAQVAEIVRRLLA